MGRQSRSHGYSLVELLVAVLFTMILMAGLGVVFKASLSASYTAGEKISSIRRNRLSMDLMYEDLNNAGMVMVDLTSPLASGTNPPFFVLPNAAVDHPVAGGPQTTDVLCFAFEQPLPFEGQLTSGGGAGTMGTTAADKVLAGTTLTVGTDDTYVIDCKDASYASQVKAGMSMQIKDNLSAPAMQIASVEPPTGTSVTVRTVSATGMQVQFTGRGDPGTLRNSRRIATSGVVFIQGGAQQVRYRIAMLNLDPSAANATPCLVREQLGFDPTSNPDSAGFFAAGASSTVIAENVSGFKAYLSANGGATWAGLGLTATGFTNGWTNGIQAALNSQLATLNRVDHTTTTGDPAWYRNNPILVRLDITTRTASQRAEYSSTPTTAAYKTLTQTTILIPRHFGLPLS